MATFDDLESAIFPVERALAKQSTLLAVDNLESILLAPFSVGGSLRDPQAGFGETGPPITLDELDAILQLCARLIFTSREALPAPFDAERHRRELHQLDREGVVKLVERVLNATALENPSISIVDGRGSSMAAQCRV